MLGVTLACLLARAPGAHAEGVVNNCMDDTDFLAKLAGGGTVKFSCGSATILLSASQTITAPTTIDGGNVITLSGGGLRRLFVVNSGAALTLTNLTIRDGYSGSADGGAIVNHGTLVVQSSRFYSNTTDAGFSGGAIESFGVLRISNSEFTHNHAGNGGALFPRESTSSTTISGSSFHENSATNSTNGWGGVALVWNGAQVTIASSTLGVSTAHQGGAIYVTSVSLVTVTNSAITSGLAITGGAVYGAAGSTLIIDRSRIAGNLALQAGGGLYTAGTATLQDGTNIDNNQAVDGAGLYNASDAFLFYVSLSANVASGYGGGLYAAQGASTHVEHSTFMGNTAALGGGAYDFGALDLWTSTLAQNAAMGGDGGAVYLDHATLASVLYSTLSGNHSIRYGGGLVNYDSDALLDHVTIAANTSLSGGGIFNDGPMTLNNSNVNGNVANDGGGISNLKTLNAKSVTLNANDAPDEGGGLENLGTATFENATFSGNRAGNGGALHSGGPAILKNATLSDNSAQQGGALFLDLASAVALTNTILANSPSGGNCGGNPINSSKFTFSSDVTCGLPSANTIKGHDPNGLDPLLTALGNYGGPKTGTGNDPLLTHLPKAISPAVDGIVGSDAPSNDERGLMRPADGDGIGGAGYDIGAVERQPNDSDLAPRMFLPVLRR